MDGMGNDVHFDAFNFSWSVFSLPNLITPPVGSGNPSSLLRRCLESQWCLESRSRNIDTYLENLVLLKIIPLGAMNYPSCRCISWEKNAGKYCSIVFLCVSLWDFFHVVAPPFKGTLGFATGEVLQSAWQVDIHLQAKQKRNMHTVWKPNRLYPSGAACQNWPKHPA